LVEKLINVGIWMSQCHLLSGESNVGFGREMDDAVEEKGDCSGSSYSDFDI